MHTGKFIKKNGKLTFLTLQDKQAYEIFVEKLQEGEKVDMFVEIYNPNHSKAQLAKVHACIRELAKEGGYTFDEMKAIVKQQTGLCSDNNGVYECKSFADCSKDELMLAIEACIQIGRDYYNLNLG
jgi:hypothetical protein